jgi:chemotaxis family two-component system response regulator Rcp1
MPKNLSEKINASYQQLQKYECGENRIPATILYVLAKQLNVPFEYFFITTNVNEIINGNILQKRSSDLKILIIEDNSIDENLIKNAIKDSGYKSLTHSIHDGNNAIRFLKYDNNNTSIAFTKPDIIFLDLNLPIKNGFEVLSEIKSNKKTALIPVIIITHSVNYKDMIRCYELNANSFLVKALKVSEFKQDIKTIVEYWYNVVITPEAA